MRKDLKIFFSKLGINCNFKPLLQSIEKCIEIVKKKYNNKKAKETHRKAYKILEKYEIEGSKKVKISPHVKFVLKKIKKQKIKLAIFSRNGKRCIMNSLRITKLKRYFDLIVSREDVKKQKPNEEGLKKILKYFKVEPKNVLLVGNDLLDWLTGKKLNIQTILIQSKKIENNLREDKNLLVIKNFFEIFNFLN